MKIFCFIVSAVFAYCVSGLNPAIIMSKAIYKKDIREYGSGNPGFTNFKRVFGNKYAWFVFALDILKGAVISVSAGLLFRQYVGSWQFGVAYAGIFALLGHAFPVFYGFKGGKGFLVCLSTLWFIDWRAGAIAAVVLTVLLIVSSCICIDNRIYGHGVIAGVRQFPHGQSHRHRRICLLYCKI